ncbi:DUF2341 domain-containing protein [Bacteroidota bacterium]
MKRLIFTTILFIAAFSIQHDNIRAQSPGNALDFDGSNDFVSIPDAAALDITNQITLEGWFKPSANTWKYKKLISVDYTKVSATLSDFPVLVSVTDTELKDTDNGGQIQPDGDDLLFKFSDGTKLSHEIEEYDGSTGKLIAWVKIPTLSSSANTNFYLYYGNSSASSQEDAENVWSSNYEGVWHLNEVVTDEASTGTHYESTANDNDGTQYGNDDVPGWIGTGQEFDGTEDMITCNNDGSLSIRNTITMSTWVKPAVDCGKDDWFDLLGMEEYDIYLGGADATKMELCYWFSLDGKVEDGWKVGNLDINPGSWYYVAVTYDGSNVYGYVNGSYDFDAPETGTIDSLTHDFMIGDYIDPPVDPLNGILDEVRVASVARDSSWIGTEYRNQFSPSTFMSIGSETAAGASKSSAYSIGTDNSLAYAAINDQILSGSIDAGAWNHIALTYNKDAGGTAELKLYINGTETATADYSTAISSNAADLILGDMSGFIGLMDEVRLWNDVRTEQEIRENMHRVVTPGSEANLVAYWQFNESSGTSASDSKGSNTGTLTNMTNDDWVTSPAPFGGGDANTTNSFTSGTTDLGKLSLTTTDAFDSAVDLTSTRITNEPNTLPTADALLDSIYWVVDVFGTPGTYETNLTFTVPSGFIDPGDEHVMKLFNRSSNSDGSWTILIEQAVSITDTTVTFENVSTLGQFLIGKGTPMPVELTSFSGVFENEGITLRWHTATEVNNYGFEIERNTSDDPSEGRWETIDFVTGYGNSNSPKEYTYTDNNISSGGTYHYRLRQIDFDGTFEYSPQIDVEVEMLHKFVLHQNYPNPFNPTTKISFELPAETIVKVTIYNILGEVVEVLTNDVYPQGRHELVFDGGRLAAGMYCYSLQAGNNRLMGKMLLLK